MTADSPATEPCWQDVLSAGNSEAKEVSLEVFTWEFSAGPLALRLLHHLLAPFRHIATSQPSAKVQSLVTFQHQAESVAAARGNGGK